MIKSQFEKQIAILHQKISFNETKLNEVKIQQEEGEKVHEALLKASKEHGGKKDFNKDIFQFISPLGAKMNLIYF